MARAALLNRSFSTREKVLLLILAVLLVGVFYYYFVVKGVADTMAANEDALADVQVEIDQQTALATVRAKMESELAGMGDLQPLPEVATYDNLSNEINELNRLMAAAQTYDMKFEQPTLDGKLVRRTVNISFTCANYGAALDVVRSLENGTYRCQIGAFSLKGDMLADGSIKSVSASVSVTYFETTTGTTNTNGLTEEEKKA